MAISVDFDQGFSNNDIDGSKEILGISKVKILHILNELENKNLIYTDNYGVYYLTKDGIRYIVDNNLDTNPDERSRNQGK